MITKTRAKFQCTAVTRSAHTLGSAYRFQAVSDSTVPEDERFARYTPVGTLEITVDNPNVEFELGTFYYLDIFPVPVEQ